MGRGQRDRLQFTSFITTINLLMILLASEHEDTPKSIIHVFFKDFFISLFMRDTERERNRDRDTGIRRSRLLAGSPMWDLILDLQDHALG